MPDSPSTRSRARALRRDMTPAEVALWSVVRRGALGVRFRRQHPIGPFFADFACPARKLVVELDGQGHYEDWSGYEERREAYLRERGYRVLVFENRELLENLEGVLELIREALVE